MSPWDRMRQVIQARLSAIIESGVWHMEDVITELQDLLEEIDRLEEAAP